MHLYYVQEHHFVNYDSNKLSRNVRVVHHMCFTKNRYSRIAEVLNFIEKCKIYIPNDDN